MELTDAITRINTVAWAAEEQHSQGHSDDAIQYVKDELGRLARKLNREGIDMPKNETPNTVEVYVRHLNDTHGVEIGRFTPDRLADLADAMREQPVYCFEGPDADYEDARTQATQWVVENGRVRFEIIVV